MMITRRNGHLTRTQYRRARVALAPSALAGVYGAAKYMAKKVIGKRTAPASSKVVSTLSSRRATQKKSIKILKPDSKKGMVRRLKIVESKVNKLKSIHTFKVQAGARYSFAQNLNAWGEIYRCTPTLIETAFSNVRYFNPADPGVLISSSIGTGTYDRDYKVNCYATITLRNNNLVPQDIIIYLAKSKQATSTAVITAMEATLVDNGGSNINNTMIYMKDCDEQVKDFWSVSVAKKCRLQPGGEIKLSHSTGFFDYNPAVTDLVTSTYNPDSKAFGWIIRVQGVLAHDKTSNGNLGFIGGAVDIITKEIYTLKYNSGGPQLETVIVSDGLNTMAAGPVVSQLATRNQESSANAV